MCSRVYCLVILLLSLTVFGCSEAVELNVPDMMCAEGCGAKVKEILSEQPGAKEVIVDFDAKTATVAIEGGGKFDANAAVAALVDHGFKNSSVKTETPPLDPPQRRGEEVVAKPKAAGSSAVQ